MTTPARKPLADNFDLILIGLRGSGKSTLARELARAISESHNTQPEVIDLDDLTPAVLGAATVAEAFTTHGEPAFRKAELHSLRQLLETRPAIRASTASPQSHQHPARASTSPARIIALGGGTPTASDAHSTAADLLRHARVEGHALIIYLHLTPTALRQRLESADNAHRPALTSAGALDEIPALYATRDPLYRDLANITLDADSTQAPTISQSILASTMFDGE